MNGVRVSKVVWSYFLDDSVAFVLLFYCYFVHTLCTLCTLYYVYVILLLLCILKK